MQTDTTHSNDATSALLMTFAHDLRQPLRSIIMATQRIQRKPQELTGDTRAKLDEIIAAVRKQEELIAAVVEYDQALQSGLDADTRLALRLVIQTACMKVDAYRQARKGAIRFEPDAVPKVYAPSGLARVLEKILHNSLKFHPADAIPQVEMEVADNDSPGMLAIRIMDNGLGIDKEYRDAVFQPFKRLNPASEYPGSGMGLATCRRLMDSIRGSVSFEDHNRDKGSAIVVRFPRMEVEA
jgi:signal transduction histidine kinase